MTFWGKSIAKNLNENRGIQFPLTSIFHSHFDTLKDHIGEYCLQHQKFLVHYQGVYSENLMEKHQYTPIDPKK